MDLERPVLRAQVRKPKTNPLFIVRININRIRDTRVSGCHYRRKSTRRQMGEKKIKKENRSSHKKVATNEKPILSWPNLPLERGRTIKQYITGLGGITKSWISSSSSCIQPKQTCPQLAEINISPENRNNIKLRPDKETPIYEYFNRNVRTYRGMYLKGYSHQRLVVLHSDFHISIFGGGPNSCLRWDTSIPFKLATLSSVPDYSRPENYNTIGNLMVITGIASPAFAFCRWDSKDYEYGKRYSWKMKDCRVTEPYSGDRYMEFTNAIGFKGKYYAISRQGSLALIEDEGNSGNFEITALGRNRVVPCKVSRHFREYLLEHKGEIFLVLLVSRASVNVVNDVEVFRLDTSRLAWEKVDRLFGDTVFFVEDQCCMGISASLLGCSRGNCVYFTHDRVDNDTWFVFDMKTGCISTTSGPKIDLPISE